MNKAKAMLDALMGPSRDLAPHEMKEDWRDRKVCKPFLVAFCPHEKSMLGGRRSFEVCDKIHNEMLRDSFNKHADGASDSSFRRDCEDKALRVFADILCAKDAYANEQRASKNADLKLRLTGPNKEIGKMKREVMTIKEQADELDDTQGIEVATRKQQLMAQYAERLKEYDAFVKEEEKRERAAQPKASSCEICGTAYLGDDEYQQHLKYKTHGIYEKVHEHVEKLKKKKEEEKEKKNAARDEKSRRQDDDNSKSKRNSDEKNDDTTKSKRNSDEKNDDNNKSKRNSDEKNDDNNKNKRDGEKRSAKKDSRSRSRKKDKPKESWREKDSSNRNRDNRRGDRSLSRGGRKRSRSRRRSRSRSRDRGRRR